MARLILFGLPITPPFSRPIDEEEPYIFVDTNTGEVYSCKRNSDNIEKNWLNLDNCLCELLEVIAASKKVVYNIP